MNSPSFSRSPAASSLSLRVSWILLWVAHWAGTVSVASNDDVADAQMPSSGRPLSRLSSLSRRRRSCTGRTRPRYPSRAGTPSSSSSLSYVLWWPPYNASSHQIGALFGTLGYAETEFWVSALKILVIVMFFFIAIVCICGGGPAGGAYDSYVGARYWHNPGAFANGFKGVCSVFVTAAFSYAG